MMIKKQHEDIHYLQFELLSEIPKISHAVFLKGNNFTLSKGPLEKVMENRKRALEILNISKLVVPYQIHSKEVREVSSIDEPDALKCDAFITHHKDLALMIKHADCQAALIYDTRTGAIANVHSGWRGSVQNIYQATIQSMQMRYASKPEDLIVCIGPSLGPQSAEFKHYKDELPESFWNYQVKPNYFDFWAISKDQLLECGVKEEHIEIAEIDTFEDTVNCFSYRKDKETGRHGTLIAKN